MSHGRPRPRKTLTALLPVTFPMAECVMDGTKGVGGAGVGVGGCKMNCVPLPASLAHRRISEPTCVSVVIVDSRRLRSKSVGQRGAKRDESDGGDLVLEAHYAAEEAGEVANEGGNQPDDAQSDKEARPAAAVVGWRHQRKHKLGTWRVCMCEWRWWCGGESAA